MDTTLLVHQNELPTRNMAHEVVKSLQGLDPALLQEATEAVQQAMPRFEGETLVPARHSERNGRPSRTRLRRSSDDAFDADSVKLALQDRNRDRSHLAEHYGISEEEIDSNLVARKREFEQQSKPEDPNPVLIGLSDQKEERASRAKGRNSMGEADSIQLALNDRKKGRAVRKESRLGEADSIKLALNDRKKDRVSRVAGQNTRIGEADSIKLALNDRKKDRVARYREPNRTLGERDSITLLKESKIERSARRVEQRAQDEESEMILSLNDTKKKNGKADRRTRGYFGEVDSVHDSPRKRTDNDRKDRGTGTPPNPVEAALHEAGLDGSGLPVNDIKKYVLEQIPLAIREQIPDNEWDKIFGGLSESASHESDSDPSGSEPSYGQIEFKPRDFKIDGLRLPEVDDEPLDPYGEDMTIVSDISGLTSAFPGTVAADNQSLSSEMFYNIETTMPLSGLSVSGESNTKKVSGSSQKTYPTVPDSASVSSWSFYNKETIIPLSGDKVCLEPSPATETATEAPTVESGPPESATIPTESSITCDTAIADRFKQQHTQQPHTQQLQQSTGSTAGVTFGNVVVRYYENILDDNPAVQCGPPIGIGWRFLIGEVVKVDEWEAQKDIPRVSAELVMPPHVRMAILRDRGYADREVADVIRGVRKIKAQRKQTVINLGSAKLEEAVEKALKKVRRRVKGALRMGFLKKK